MENFIGVVTACVFMEIWVHYVGHILSVYDYFWCFVLFISTNIIHSFLIEVEWEK